MPDDLPTIRCGECDKVVGEQIPGAIILRRTHATEKGNVSHVTIITVDKLLGEAPLKPSLKRV